MTQSTVASLLPSDWVGQYLRTTAVPAMLCGALLIASGPTQLVAQELPATISIGPMAAASTSDGGPDEIYFKVLGGPCDFHPPLEEGSCEPETEPSYVLPRNGTGDKDYYRFRKNRGWALSDAGSGWLNPDDTPLGSPIIWGGTLAEGQGVHFTIEIFDSDTDIFPPIRRDTFIGAFEVTVVNDEQELKSLFYPDLHGVYDYNDSRTFHRENPDTNHAVFLATPLRGKERFNYEVHVQIDGRLPRYGKLYYLEDSFDHCSENSIYVEFTDVFRRKRRLDIVRSTLSTFRLGHRTMHWTCKLPDDTDRKRAPSDTNFVMLQMSGDGDMHWWYFKEEDWDGTECRILHDAGNRCGVQKRIVGLHSDMCVHVAGFADGANVVQGGCRRFSRDLWNLSEIGGGLYRIASSVTGRCLDVARGGTADGTNIQQWTCHGGANQQWWLEEVEPSKFFIVPRHSSFGAGRVAKCLDVSRSGNVHQWTCHGGANQRFTLQ